MKLLLTQLRKRKRIKVSRPDEKPNESVASVETSNTTNTSKTARGTTPKKTKKTIQNCVYATTGLGQKIVKEIFV